MSRNAAAGFPKSARIRKRADFLRIQSDGIRIQTRHFILLVSACEERGSPRLGIVASRKVGTAVQRNRARRMLRESFRRMRPRIAALDIVVIVRSSATKLMCGDIDLEMGRLLPSLRKAAEQLAPMGPRSSK